MISLTFVDYFLNYPAEQEHNLLGASNT